MSGEFAHSAGDSTRVAVTPGRGVGCFASAVPGRRSRYPTTRTPRRTQMNAGTRRFEPGFLFCDIAELRKEDLYVCKFARRRGRRKWGGAEARAGERRTEGRREPDGTTSPLARSVKSWRDPMAKEDKDRGWWRRIGSKD